MKNKTFNLLDDILEVLSDSNIPESSIKWVGGEEFKTTWKQFKDVAENTDYTDISQLPTDLVIFGNGYYLTVGEDNYDRIILTRIPIEPSRARSIDCLSTKQSFFKEAYPYLHEL